MVAPGRDKQPNVSVNVLLVTLAFQAVYCIYEYWLISRYRTENMLAAVIKYFLKSHDLPGKYKIIRII